ncbi:hypothetical protein FM107_07950 [Sphingobacterium sp. JB170]|nr:hypothetical protein FM107_07950 [Sphingobacterium sp. JB170]
MSASNLSIQKYKQLSSTSLEDLKKLILTNTIGNIAYSFITFVVRFYKKKFTTLL